MTASLLSFLQESAEYPKLYWKSRGSDIAWGGLGTHKEIQSTHFLIQSFSPTSCQGVWSCFAPSFLWSPHILKSQPWEPCFDPSPFPKLLNRKDTPSFDRWRKMVTDAAVKIEREDLRKVVLARQTTLTFQEKLDPLQLLQKLMPLGNETSLFLIQLDPETTFLGATPEKLFERKKRKITSEALAGTKTRDEEWSMKETSEIEAVQVFLHDRLLKCCNSIQWHPPEQKSFANLNHLYQGIEGHLKDDIWDQDLIGYLHPTPGLGGLPQKEAIDFITENEPFSRGWYGGLIGMFSPEESDVSVSIRSALIQGNQMHLFSGAGIVKGSKPEKEWEELDRKIAQFIKIL